MSCCCWSCSDCCDTYCGGALSSCVYQAYQEACINVGSPPCIVTNPNDQPIIPCTGSLLQGNPSVVAAIPCSPLTSGTTCNPLCAFDCKGISGQCKKPSSSVGSTGAATGGLSGSGSASGAGNAKSSSNCSALTNALNKMGSALTTLIGKTNTTPVNQSAALNASSTPTNIGMIVIVVLLGALLLAMAFGGRN